MRNLLNLLSVFLGHWTARLEGMIHPSAADDVFLAPLHRSFLISATVAGTSALVVLPLHLALAGPPHVVVTLMLSWLLSQWPLALYLSRSGALDRTIGLSASLFAGFVAAICVLTGGSASFAFLWLLVPPVEAAFSTSRKTAYSVTLLCAGLLIVVSVAPATLMEVAPLPTGVTLLASVAAIFYVGLLAIRISADRKHARSLMKASEGRRQLINQSVSEVFCELKPDGGLSVMGGPVKELLGISAGFNSDSWLFSRLHVADRPLYLTKLSEARNEREATPFDVRLRVGASSPGETGQAEYRNLTLKLRPPAQETGLDTKENGSLLLSLRAAEELPVSSLSQPLSEGAKSRLERISAEINETAGRGVRTALENVLSRAADLEHIDLASDRYRFEDAARDIKRSSQIGLSALADLSDLMVGQGENLEPVFAKTDIAAALEYCLERIGSAADRQGVQIETIWGQNLPLVFVDGALVRKALCFVLLDMIATSGSGAKILVEANCSLAGFELLFSVKDRKSSLQWSSEDSKPVLAFAGDLLERTNACLKVQTMLGHGESVCIRLPARVAPFKDFSTDTEHAETRPLAKMA